MCPELCNSRRSTDTVGPQDIRGGTRANAPLVCGTAHADALPSLRCLCGSISLSLLENAWQSMRSFLPLSILVLRFAPHVVGLWGSYGAMPRLEGLCIRPTSAGVPAPPSMACVDRIWDQSRPVIHLFYHQPQVKHPRCNFTCCTLKGMDERGMRGIGLARRLIVVTTPTQTR